MKQGNGTDLLGANDPRSKTIGIIYVSANDDRKSILTALLTQEKLDRKYIVIALQEQAKAFSRPQDFDDLKGIRRRLKAQIVFVAPNGPGPAEFARQRRFPVYSSLESFAQSLGDGEEAEQNEKRPGLFGARSRRLVPQSAEAVAAIAAATAATNRSRQRSVANSTNANSQFRNPQNLRNPQEPQTDAKPPLQTSPLPRPVPVAAQQHTLDEDDDDDAPPTSSTSHIAGTAAGVGAIAANALSARRGTVQPITDHNQAIAQGIEAQSANAGEPVSAVNRTPSPLDEEDWEGEDLPVPPQRGSKTARMDRSGRNGMTSLSEQTASQTSRNAGARSAALAAGVAGAGMQGAIDEEDVSDPGIITLRPTRNRSTVKLNEPNSTAVPVTPTPITRRPARSRPNNDEVIAFGAGAAGGAALAASTSTGRTRTTAAAGGGAGTVTRRPSTGNTPPGGPNNRRRRPLWQILLVLLLLLLATCVILCGLFDAFNPAAFAHYFGAPISKISSIAGASPATVTVTPDSKTIQNNYIIQAVPGTPNADQQQVSLRTLTSSPTPQTQQVNGTGHTQIPATKATGTLTFVNGSASDFTIGTGTTFQANGITFALDAPVSIPGSNLSATPVVIGQKAMTAHATTAGAVGNIAANTINGQCCTSGNFITVKNGTFTGGQDAQNYTFVQKADVDSAAQPLLNTLSQEAQSDFQKQLKSNEQLLGKPSCSSQVNYDPNTVGDQGHTITSTAITVSATCSGQAYDYGGAQTIAKNKLQQKATAQLGSSYKLAGNIVTQASNVSQQQKTASLQINASGVWAYQVTDAFKQQLAKQLAGKKVKDAQAILDQQTGIAHATISLPADATMPSDPGQITIDVQSIAGETGNGNSNGGNGNPSAPGNGNNSSVTPTPQAGKGFILKTSDVKG